MAGPREYRSKEKDLSSRSRAIRSRVRPKQRSRRFSASVVAVCLLISTMTLVLVESPGIASATAVNADGPQVCIQCPSGETGCGPEHCSPTCSPTPYVNSYNSAIQANYRQAWVNWTFTGTTTTFEWQESDGGPNLPLPEISINSGDTAASVNLNSLTANTQYYYEISATNSCGTSPIESGVFTTGPAPTNEIVGWVSSVSSNPYEVDQIGSPLSGAEISVNATCPAGPVGLTQVTFPDAATTTSSGSYAISFPLQIYIPELTVVWSLWSTGYCSGSQRNVSSPDYTLRASLDGYWNATDFISSSLTATNDYHQFGLPPNVQTYSVPGIAFVHTEYASCGVTITTTISQTINSDVAGDGFTDQTSWTSGVTASPVSNGESSVAFHEYTSGVVNETAGATNAATYAVGNVFDPSQNAVSVVDPLPPPSPGQTYPIPGYPGYQVETVGGTGGGLSWYNGGSYASTAGLDISVSIGGEWDGVAFGPTIQLSYTTTTGTSSQKEISCTFADSGEPTGEYAQFYYFVDGSQASSQDAINVHVWFDDYCVPNQTTCN
jgi:hypothetical protein